MAVQRAFLEMALRWPRCLSVAEKRFHGFRLMRICRARLSAPFHPTDHHAYGAVILNSAESRAEASLAQYIETYRQKAKRWPFGVPHFGIRYGSEAEIEAVEQRLDIASKELRHRTEVRLFRPGPNSPSEFIQGFIHQDVIVAGSFFLGQLIELQYQRAFCSAG